MVSMKKENFESQDFVDFWVKKQFKASWRLAKTYWKKSERFQNRLKEKDWKKEFKKVENIYFANKAIYFNANRDIPFTTLSLVGQILSDKKSEQKMKYILNQNVFTYEGNVFKLDDLENQTKIRKALRTHKFEQVSQHAA